MYRIIIKDKIYAINSTPQLERKNPKFLESSETSTKSNMHKHRCTDNERNLYKQTCTTYVSIDQMPRSRYPGRRRRELVARERERFRRIEGRFINPPINPSRSKGLKKRLRLTRGIIRALCPFG